MYSHCSNLIIIMLNRKMKVCFIILVSQSCIIVLELGVMCREQAVAQTVKNFGYVYREAAPRQCKFEVCHLRISISHICINHAGSSALTFLSNLFLVIFTIIIRYPQSISSSTVHSSTVVCFSSPIVAFGCVPYSRFIGCLMIL